MDLSGEIATPKFMALQGSGQISFQNIEESANIIDSNLELFFRSAYRKNNQIGDSVDLSLENVFINNLSESCVMKENEITLTNTHFCLYDFKHILFP